MSPAAGAQFSTSLDRTTKIISSIACAGLAALALAVHSIAVAALAALVIGATFAYSPRGYTVSEQSIIVRRLIGNIFFPIEDLREARRTSATDLQGCIRLWGSGGLFGYHGLFRTSRLGKCWWYVTNRRNTVVVIAGQKTALFSPEDVDGFLAAVRAAAAVPQSGAWSGEMPEGTGTRLSVYKWTGIAIVLVALAFAGFAVSYSPGPPRYTVTPAALTIHDLFYPVTVKAADVDISGIRIVDISADPAWRPTARVNGFSNSHYHSGWFRVASGRKVRMYWTNGRRLVLLPPRANGVPLLIEVRNPQDFVRNIQREWQASP